MGGIFVNPAPEGQGYLWGKFWSCCSWWQNSEKGEVLITDLSQRIFHEPDKGSDTLQQETGCCMVDSWLGFSHCLIYWSIQGERNIAKHWIRGHLPINVLMLSTLEVEDGRNGSGVSQHSHFPFIEEKFEPCKLNHIMNEFRNLDSDLELLFPKFSVLPSMCIQYGNHQETKLFSYRR